MHKKLIYESLHKDLKYNTSIMDRFNYYTGNGKILINNNKKYNSIKNLFEECKNLAKNNIILKNKLNILEEEVEKEIEYYKEYGTTLFMFSMVMGIIVYYSYWK